METKSRCFPYDKSIVINALYDTIEALGLRLDSSDSMRGLLVVSDEQQTERMRIDLDAAVTKTQTQVSIYPESPDGSLPASWSEVIFDELSATIERARRCANR
ncbi:MAG: hypothetical protein ACOX75_00920 [Lachnospiraceae bacterium]|jgi:hypothetical protein